MYLWIKALHLIAMVAWFAGLFYMFRLFVYHAENHKSPQVTALLKVMARRLYYFITFPAMGATLIFGITLLVLQPEVMRFGWIHAKLTLLVLLVGYHHYIGFVRKRFARDQIILSARACRILNEVPTIFLIAIILLAVLRPF